MKIESTVNDEVGGMNVVEIFVCECANIIIIII